jgi:hypothetical protein
MVKPIRLVKSKARLKVQLPNQLKKYTQPDKDELALLDAFAEVDPIFEGNPDKFDVIGTRIKWQKHVVSYVDQPGYWMEFGVRGGTSIGWLLEQKPGQEIHGFDSWEGLPEQWSVIAETFDKGAMAVPMPKFDSNVKLWKGWFNDTVEPWCANHPGNIAYLHIDSDLYSSAIYVLNTLNKRIVPGTIIVFDELANFRLSTKMSNWPMHEWKALNEWLKEYNRKVEPITRSCMYQAAVRVVQ